MSVKVIGAASGTEADVDTDRNVRMGPRPPAFGSLGAYRIGVVSGSITATLAANAALFSARWTNTPNLALIQMIRAAAICDAAITTGVVFDLEAIVARSFTASDSAGTSVLPTGNSQKMRTSMGTTLFGDMRVSAAVALTAGTRTLDGQGIGRIQGFSGTALGTSFFGSGGGAMPLYVRDNNDAHPLILAQNEGIIVRAPLVGPATGTFKVLIEMEWLEVAAY